MQPDPIAGELTEPQSLNRYTYSLNDPANLFDPLGLLTCMIDWMEAPCHVAWGLLRSGAGVVYNGSSIQNINGQLAPIHFDAGGNAFWYVRVAMDSNTSGMIMGYEDDGSPIYRIGVTEKTIKVEIPFGALPLDWRIARGYREPPVEMLVGPSVVMAAPFAGLLRAGSGAATVGTGVQATNALTQTGIKISEHALKHMADEGISKKMVEAAIRMGQRFWDSKNSTYQYVLRNGFASGKDLWVARNPVSGLVTTVHRTTRSVRPRWIPF
jgi:hypothetical protein